MKAQQRSDTNKPGVIQRQAAAGSVRFTLHMTPGVHPSNVFRTAESAVVSANVFKVGGQFDVIVAAGAPSRPGRVAVVPEVSQRGFICGESAEAYAQQVLRAAEAAWLDSVETVA